MFLSCIQLAHVMWAAWGWGRRPPGLTASPLLLVLRCLAQVLSTGFHRFLARFSGRRRSRRTSPHNSPPPWTTLVLVIASTSLFSVVDACSSRTTPKPRPPAPTPRPNITYPMYPCPPDYAAWYCLNGARCFAVKIRQSQIYDCECADGYVGARCEYKNVDKSYLHTQQMVETASIAGGATIAILFVFIVCFYVYVQYKRRVKLARTSTDCVDSPLPANRPIFGARSRGTLRSDLPIPHHQYQHHHHIQHQQQQQQHHPHHHHHQPDGRCATDPTKQQSKTELRHVTTITPPSGNDDNNREV